MRLTTFAWGAVAPAIMAAPALAQFGSAIPTPAKGVQPVSVTPSTGGYLGGLGGDDCAAAEPIAGAGVFSFDQAGATTGAEGQAEGICYFFGTSGLENDVWFGWTAGEDGFTTMTTCGGTAIDTKLAVYPGSGCPADGTSLACNDDACGLQSTVSWDAVGGDTYTLQVGTFPGASGGSGTFEISVVAEPPSCPDFSDSTSENSLGLTVGGDIAMLQYYDCLAMVGNVEAAFGTPANPDPSLDGLPVTVCVYSDDDNDPTNGMTLLESTTGIITNASTDTFVAFPLNAPAPINGSGWVAVTVECQVPGQFPLPFDTEFPNDGAWVAGDTTCNLDHNDLTNSDVGLLPMAGIGFPGSWLMRAEEYVEPPVATPFCFGDGTGTPCPCGENGAPESGCPNSAEANGCDLTASGSASLTVKDLVLHASRGVPGQFGLFFIGDIAVNGGAGIPFGAGLRCAGGAATGRLEVRQVAPDGTASTTIELATYGPTQPGETWFYQFWYRDPVNAGCASYLEIEGFNTSNALEITWVD